MLRVLIVGAGGFGREVLCWAHDVEKTQSEWKIQGFLDANPRALDAKGIPLPVVGDPSEYMPVGDERMICAIGDPHTKKRVVTGLLRRGAEFLTLIHPTVVLGFDCRIGIGCVLCPGVVITTHVTLGEFATVNIGATIGHDVNTGDWCTINVHSDIAGGATLGDAVFLGSHAFVLPRIAVGDCAVIGAGTVAARPVPPASTVFGVPAKRIDWCVSTAPNRAKR